MTLGEKQRLFVQLVGKLIEFAYSKGYELTFGDCYRDSRCPYGHDRSLHRLRLAVDFNLFINGDYKTDTESYTLLGEYWESLNPNCSWGGRFKDGNHFSLAHDGMK